MQDLVELILELSLATLDRNFAWRQAAFFAPVNRALRSIVDRWRQYVQELHLISVASDAEMWLLASRCTRLRRLSVTAPDQCFEEDEEGNSSNDSFVLSGFALTAIGFGCQNLESVRLLCTDFWHDREIHGLVHRLRHLRAFELDDSLGFERYDLRGDFIQSLAESCPLLERLVLPSCSLMDGKHRMALLGNGYPLLRELHARFARVSSQMLCDISNSCHNLQHLDLSHARVGDQGVLALARNCTQLAVLLLDCGSDADGLSDASIVPLARSCPHLRELDLFAATSDGEERAFTDASVLALGAHCPQITFLILGHARCITDVAASSLLHEFPVLIQLDLWNCLGFTETHYQALDEKVGFRKRTRSRWVR